jgi:hypothetical protein
VSFREQSNRCVVHGLKVPVLGSPAPGCAGDV